MIIFSEKYEAAYSSISGLVNVEFVRWMRHMNYGLMTKAAAAEKQGDDVIDVETDDETTTNTPSSPPADADASTSTAPTAVDASFNDDTTNPFAELDSTLRKSGYRCSASSNRRALKRKTAMSTGGVKPANMDEDSVVEKTSAAVGAAKKDRPGVFSVMESTFTRDGLGAKSSSPPRPPSPINEELDDIRIVSIKPTRSYDMVD